MSFDCRKDFEVCGSRALFHFSQFLRVSKTETPKMTKKTLLVASTLLTVPIFSVAYMARTSDDAIAPTSEIKEAQPAQAPSAKAPANVPDVESEIETEIDPDYPNTGAITFEAGVDWTSSYFFRGYNQEDTGVIIQPYVAMTIDLADTDDLGINLYVESWNSLHSEHTGGDGIWFESDVYAMINFEFSDFTFTTGYALYTYPDDAFESIQEFGVQIAYDDSNVWDDPHGFALNPRFAVIKETSDGNGGQDTYGEFGISPTWMIPLKSRGWNGGDLEISLPVTVGMSFDDYYTDSDGDNEFFGFVSGGIVATLPLPMPAKYGEWSLVGSVEYIQMLADSVEEANDGGMEYELTGRIGIAFSY